MPRNRVAPVPSSWTPTVSPSGTAWSSVWTVPSALRRMPVTARGLPSPTVKKVSAMSRLLKR
jgi:hypothetical protein